MSRLEDKGLLPSAAEPFTTSDAAVLASPRRPPWRAKSWLVAPPALLTAAVVNIPFLYVFFRAFEHGLQAYFGTIWTASTLRLLGHTLLLVVGVVTLANLIAIPLAWLVVRTDLPARRFWAVAAALPLVFPSYVSALCLVAALGPRGYLQSWLGLESLPSLIYGYFGALLALALFTYP